MATAVWSWSGSKTANVGERTLELSGSGISGSAVVRGIYYTVGLRATKYSSSRYWSINYIRVANGPSMENVVRQSMSGTSETICHLDTTDTSLYDIYRSDTLTVSLDVECDHSTAGTYISSILVEVEYDTPGVSVTEFSVSQKGSKYLFSWKSDIIAVENVRYDIYRVTDEGDLGEDLLSGILENGISGTSVRIPRTDYGYPQKFYIFIYGEYDSTTLNSGIRSNQIIPEFMPMYVRFYKDGIGHDCSVSYYDAEKKEWLDCEVSYYDGEKWVECSSI